MLTALLIPLVTFPAAVPTTPVKADDPPVRVWLSRTDVVWPGDRVRVYAEAERDGYLVVLHAEPDGRIRMLFPIDPVDDNFVRGGSRYEVLSRSEREAITVFAEQGVGTVLAAFSRDPFRFDDLAQSGHWNYRQPDVWWVSEDAESDLLALSDRMAGGIAFDYDVQRYGVAQTVAAYRTSVSHYGYAYPGAYVYPTSGVYLSVGFSFGVPYFAYSHVHPVCWDWYYCYPGGWYYYSPYAYYGPHYRYGYYYGYRPSYYGYWRYPRAYYPYYPKYVGKGPSYTPSNGGIDYRRRPAAAPARPANARGTAPEAGRRTPATVPGSPRVSNPAGESGRRTAPAAGTPTAGGRRAAPAGTREASPPSDRGRRAVGSQPSSKAPATEGRRPAPAGAREAPQRTDQGRRPTAVSPSGVRPATGQPARTTNDAARRGDVAKGLRPEASRPTGQLPKRVYPSRGSVPTVRNGGAVRQTTGGRREAAPARPVRVVPSRSVAPSRRSPSRTPARGVAPARSAGNRSVNLPSRGRSPVRATPAPARAPRASGARVAPRAPKVSAPRAPAKRAPSVRGRSPGRRR